MNELVTIITFTFPHEVLVLRGRLESEGIECFVPDELTIQMHPFYSNALGGVRLRVRKKDVPQALEILKDGGYSPEPNLDQIEINESVEGKSELSMFKQKKFQRFFGWGVFGLIVVLLILSIISAYS